MKGGAYERRDLFRACGQRDALCEASMKGGAYERRDGYCDDHQTYNLRASMKGGAYERRD